ncbi:MAG: MASE1 domain-containing protein [Burkholderiales bacterium]|nr:MASE1 domain-containing protein [Burkholderiales bacterium]
MQKNIVLAVAVAVAYLALAWLSAVVAYSPNDAWTVWLGSGVVLGLLLALRRRWWPGILAGGFVGATLFSLYLDTSLVVALGYGAIEVIAAGAAIALATRLVPLPLRLDRGRDLAALIVVGALPLALVGAFLAALWHLVETTGGALGVFRVWFVSNVLGTLLVAPVFVAWAQFRVRRSGGMPMPTFLGGALACVLFILTVWLLFDAAPGTRFEGTRGQTLTYVPILFVAIVALLWGAPGATLAAFVGAVIALLNTAQHEGPFALAQGYLGEAEFEVQAYALAIALTGLLIAILAAGQRRAARDAREWRTRFTAAIAAHRLVAYEWDPATGSLVVSGDANELMGVPPQRLGTLADWLSYVAADDRERVTTRFDERVRGQGEADRLTYLLHNGSATLAATDEARAIRDHDGELHRVVGLVRIDPVTATAVAA